MSSDETLGRALQSVIEDVRDSGPFLGNVVAGGVARGKRIRRNQRITRFASSTAALVAVGVGVAYAAGVGPLRTDHAAGKPTFAPVYSELAKQLKALAPGLKFDIPEPLDPNATGIAADPTAIIDGKSSLEFEASKYGSTYQVGFSCPPPAEDPVTRCSDTIRPDGSWLLVEQSVDGSVVRDGGPGVLIRLSRPDGVLITLRAFNWAYGPGVPTTPGNGLPLTTTQMTALVENPVWPGLASPWAANLESPPPGVLVVDGVKAARIAPLVKPLLAADGVKQDDTGLDFDPGHPFQSPSGYYTYLDDGHGKALFNIRVTPPRNGKPGGDSPAIDGISAWNGKCGAHDLLCEVDHQPDGSILKVWQTAPNTTVSDTRSDPSGSVGHWQAMLLEKDGTTIGAEELASTALFSPATRTTPALTLDQLAAIVENPVWRQLGR